MSSDLLDFVDLRMLSAPALEPGSQNPALGPHSLLADSSLSASPSELELRTAGADSNTPYIWTDT